MTCFRKKRFYHSKSDFKNIHQQLKLSRCPFCSKTGALILHGYLRGYCINLDSYSLIRRGHRIRCTNIRKHNPGCGKTFSLLLSTLIPGLSYSIGFLWALVRTLSNCTPINTIASLFSVTRKTAWNLCMRLKKSQSHIRSNLLPGTDPPDLLVSSNPLHLTIQHLRKAFPQSTNPFHDFQMHFQLPILR